MFNRDYRVRVVSHVDVPVANIEYALGNGRLTWMPRFFKSLRSRGLVTWTQTRCVPLS